MQAVTASSWHLHRSRLLGGGMDLPDSFDVIVVGTGLVESVLAAAAARQGHSVLHLDTAKYYGADWAAFTWEGLQQWIVEARAASASGRSDDQAEAEQTEQQPGLEEGEVLVKLSKLATVENIEEKWHCEQPGQKDQKKEVEGKEEEKEGEKPDQEIKERDKALGSSETQWSREELLAQSRKFNIDLTPRLLYSRGEMVELLISSNISRYTEFKSVTRVLTLLEGKLEQVPSSRSDVFNTKKISVVEKRILMKFLTQCLQEDTVQPEDPSKTFGSYLKQQKLTPNLLHYVCHSIAMVPLDVPMTEGLASTRKFLSSLGRFGPTPFLWSMYGTGELPQAFCRLCAVFGGVYYLGKAVSSLVVREDKVTGVLIEKKIIRCSQLVLPASQSPGAVKSKVTSRAVFLSSQSVAPSEKEQVTFLSLPQNTGPAINIIEVGAGAAATPRGLHLLQAGGEGELDLELVCRTKELVKEDSLLYTLTFNQVVEEEAAAEGKFSNLWPAPGPRHELDFDLAIQAARNIYSRMFPGEDFLPRAPDPEEIVFGGEEEEEGKAEEKVEKKVEKKEDGDGDDVGDETCEEPERVNNDCDEANTTEEKPSE